MIKQVLNEEIETHQLSILISIFREAFLFENRYLLCTGDIFEDRASFFSISELKIETARCIREL